jgi:LytS/YehU family sensor histidine kinase
VINYVPPPLIERALAALKSDRSLKTLSSETTRALCLYAAVSDQMLNDVSMVLAAAIQARAAITPESLLAHITTNRDHHIATLNSPTSKGTPTP